MATLSLSDQVAFGESVALEGRNLLGMQYFTRVKKQYPPMCAIAYFWFRQSDKWPRRPHKLW